MGVGIALHQPPRIDELDGEVVIAPRRFFHASKPSIAVRGFVGVAQRTATEALHAGHEIERQEPAQRRGLHPPAAVDDAIEGAEQPRAAFDEAAEPDRQRAGNLVHAWMHELGGVHELVVRHADFGAHTGEASGACLEVGDAIDVVIGHGDGKILRRGARQRVGLRRIVELQDIA